MKTALTIEDDDSVRMLIATVLGFEDFTVVEAANGERALELAFEHRPDIVLLDQHLPGSKSGIDICRAMRAARLRAPIVFITSDELPAQREAAIAAGANVLLTKPFDPLQLVELVANLVGETARVHVECE